jgi:hypothetical protein
MKYWGIRASHRTKGHMENKKHMGMGSLCYNALDLCYKQLTKWVQKPQGVSLGWAEWVNQIKNEEETRKDKSIMHSYIRVCPIEWF